MQLDSWDEQIRRGRAFLTDTIRKHTDFSLTDQQCGMEPPPVQVPLPSDMELCPLPGSEDWKVPPISVQDAIAARRSVRDYREAALTLPQLSFLLWATQGIRGSVRHGHALRTVPSAGCRHPFETWLAVLDIEGLQPGLYRYRPVEHALAFLHQPSDLRTTLTSATFGQRFCARSSVVFIWTAIPYRTEWRYGPAAHKVIALDAGHVCQNLYLACEAIGAGTCAIAAYDQQAMDLLLGVDGDTEFTIYLAPVGLKYTEPDTSNAASEG